MLKFNMYIMHTHSIMNAVYMQFIPMFCRVSKQIDFTLARLQSGKQVVENVEISLASILLHNSRFLQQVLSNHS